MVRGSTHTTAADPKREQRGNTGAFYAVAEDHFVLLFCFFSLSIWKLGWGALAVAAE